MQTFAPRAAIKTLFIIHEMRIVCVRDILFGTFPASVIQIAIY